MKNIKYIVLFIAFITMISITTTNIATSSSMFDGEMDAQILKIISKKQDENKKNLYHCKLEFEIIKVRYEGGHKRNHKLCQEMVGRIMTKEFSIDFDKYKKIIQKDKFIIVYYKVVFNPPKRFKRWEFRGESIDFSKNKPILYKEDDYFGYKDYKGNAYISPRFLEAYDFNDKGIAAVADQYHWYYINTYGRFVIYPLVVDYQPDKFKEGLARYKDRSNDKIGFFDETGKITITAKYYYAYSFSEGLAAVCTNISTQYNGQHRLTAGGKWGFINKKGELVIKDIYSKVSSFKDGVAVVYTKDHKKILIDKKGNEVKK